MKWGRSASRPRRPRHWDWRTGCSKVRSAVTLASAVALLASASCGGRADQNIRMRTRTGEAATATRKCTQAERAEIRLQLEVIRNYWALPYADEYNTFSSGFKQILNDAGVSTAADYANVMASNQRQWLRQTYQEAELEDTTHGRVTVLAEWKEGNYQGVQSVIFDMVREDGAWKIDSIFY